jgi:MFS family permease
MSEVAQARTRAARGVLAVTCISTLVVNANTSAVSILLPAISEDTGTSVTTLQWAVTGYSLVGAAVIVTSGSLGDVFGRKRVFQLGLLLFVASCVLIALAGSGGMVIAGRVIQGAAGATILACGLSLLSVANEGAAQLRAVSLWGAAAAVGAAAGPLLGGVLVDITGWQGLFWIDAAVAVVCMVLTFATVTESRDPDRPRSIDLAGTVLVAKSGEWGWLSVATLGCFAISVAAGFGFIAVERRVAVPLLDLALLRNRVLVGSTVAILIGAGTINGLMYLLSLYFQNPAVLDFSPLQAGLATLPATVGLVVVAPLVPRLAARFGGRQTVGIGFALTTAGFVVVGFVDDSWKYAAFLLPLIAIAVGMGLSNMARYVGAAVATALAATIYGTRIDDRTAAGASPGEALASGLAAAAWMMAIFSFLGVLMAVVMGRHRAPVGTLDDAAAAAAAHTHTLPTSATTGRDVTADA